MKTLVCWNRWNRRAIAPQQTIEMRLLIILYLATFSAIHKCMVEQRTDSRQDEKREPQNCLLLIAKLRSDWHEWHVSNKILFWFSQFNLMFRERAPYL
jgi:hypothetical protein